MAKRKKGSKSGIVIDVDPWGVPTRGLTPGGMIGRDYTGDGRKSSIKKNVDRDIFRW